MQELLKLPSLPHASEEVQASCLSLKTPAVMCCLPPCGHRQWDGMWAIATLVYWEPKPDIAVFAHRTRSTLTLR